jgi:2-polyprenyl-3-methyl-5-hydroxy-6-metoxy-1,4-benzoquinol methylase
VRPLTQVRRRLRFGASLLGQRLKGSDRTCPYCGESTAVNVGRKLLLLQVIRCQCCGLMYRVPKATPAQSAVYYEAQYGDFEQGPVTSLPTIEEVRELQRRGFAESVWGAKDRLRLITQLKAQGRLLDYGCSWGYFVAQAKAAGFDAIGYEISRTRAKFGQQMLNIEVLHEATALEGLQSGSIDVIYSSHVLEHLTSLTDVFPLFRRLLAPGGILMIFVPNCGGLSARTLGLKWGPFTNEAHTLSFDAAFFGRNLPNEGFDIRCLADPYPDNSLLDPHMNASLDGEELLVLARKSGSDRGYHAQ